MGMDINGLNPQIKGDEPPFPDNWDKLSDKAKECYMELDKEYHDNNPGVYFRANIWSWRPIYYAILESNRSLDLGIDADTIDGMAFNSGHGLKTQEECTKLADALQILVDGMTERGVTEYGFNLGMWTFRDGSIVDKEDTEALNAEYGEGSLITDLPLILATKEKTRRVWPAHVVKLDHLEEFILFLRHCGGFEIY